MRQISSVIDANGKRVFCAKSQRVIGESGVERSG
jgi:hypothetical protein